MLTGKTAVVTGGTRGIGFAIAKKFLENGANVAIAGSRQESVDKALAKLPEYAGRVMGIWPDICSPEEVAAAFASVKEKFGSLDILANNAGVSSSTSLYDYKPGEFEKVMNLNVNAVFTCAHSVAPIMREQGGGVIFWSFRYSTGYTDSTGSCCSHNSFVAVISSSTGGNEGAILIFLSSGSIP